MHTVANYDKLPSELHGRVVRHRSKNQEVAHALGFGTTWQVRSFKGGAGQADLGTSPGEGAEGESS